ncbi:MAG: patatin-like phospholipase family protein [Burkholderiales bacterium]|nr:patatin-like phospholipase family protein [Burkholderiales bacterium]
MQSFTLFAGQHAAAHLRREGLKPGDIGCVPAAAGGPKGLALIPLDRRLFGAAGWLREVPLDLVGASIGAWRMFCAAQVDAEAALRRLSEGYVAQRYNREPTTQEVSDECRKLARAVLGESGWPALRAQASVLVLTTRARGVLQGDASRAAFAKAALANTLSRARLAAHMERVVFAHGAPRVLHTDLPAFDPFGLTMVPLTPDNAEDALLASGSIPLVCDPVRNPGNAPRGDYWDGGLIDYHLLLPYRSRRHGATVADGKLVLYPHFVPYVTPGWLDKYLPWRKRARGHAWLSNMLLIAPSPAFLARLPNKKLPDRQDFYRYGLDHEGRARDWRRAISECERFADEVMGWLERPDPSLLRPL